MGLVLKLKKRPATFEDDDEDDDKPSKMKAGKKKKHLRVVEDDDEEEEKPKKKLKKARAVEDDDDDDEDERPKKKKGAKGKKAKGKAKGKKEKVIKGKKRQATIGAAVAEMTPKLAKRVRKVDEAYEAKENADDVIQGALKELHDFLNENDQSSFKHPKHGYYSVMKRGKVYFWRPKPVGKG